MGRSDEQYPQSGRGDHKERNDLYLIKNAAVWIVWTAAFPYEFKKAYEKIIRVLLQGP